MSLSIKDVALRAGCSIATVSRVLAGKGYISEEARKKVEEAVKELGYRPNRVARSLRAQGGHPPFIFITAHDDAQTHAEATAAGCAAYFRKNDPGADIVHAIRRLAR